SHAFKNARGTALPRLPGRRQLLRCCCAAVVWALAGLALRMSQGLFCACPRISGAGQFHPSHGKGLVETWRPGAPGELRACYPLARSWVCACSGVCEKACAPSLLWQSCVKRVPSQARQRPSNRAAVSFPQPGELRVCYPLREGGGGCCCQSPLV